MKNITAETIISEGLKAISRQEITEIKEPVEDLHQKIELRDYQGEVVADANNLFGEKNIVSAEIYCGGGKTIIGGTVIANWIQEHPGKHVFFISPNRASFVHFKQDIYRAVSSFAGLKMQITTSGFEKDKKIHIMTHVSFLKWKQKNPEQFEDVMKQTSLFVLDEAHRYPEDEGESKYIGELAKVLKRKAKKHNFKILALTGTHFRMDKYSPLGIKDADIRITMQDLINKEMAPEVYGITIPIKLDNSFSVSKNGEEMIVKPSGVSAADVRKKLQLYYDQIAYIIYKIQKADPTAGHCVFTSTCEDAKSICEEINARLGKPLFVEMTSKSGKIKDRPEILSKLQSGELLGYVTVNVGAESLNVKRLKYCHIITRTTSNVKLMQMVGRIMRKCEGKPRVFIVDYQVLKRKIIKLAKGLKHVHALCGSKRELKGVGGGICVKDSTELPDCHISLGELEEFLVKESFTGAVRGLDYYYSWMLTAKRKPSPESKMGGQFYRYCFPNNKDFNKQAYEDTKRIHPDWFMKELNGLDYYYSWMPTARKKPLHDSKDCEERRQARQISKYCLQHSSKFNPQVYADTKRIHPDWFTLKGLDYYYSWMPTAKKKPSTASKDLEEKRQAKQFYKFCKSNSQYFNQQTYEDTKRIHPDWFEKSFLTLEDYYLWMPIVKKKPSCHSKNPEEKRRAWQISRYCNPNSKCFNKQVYEDTKRIHPDWFKLVGLDYYYSWMPMAKNKPSRSSKNPEERQKARQIEVYCCPTNKRFNKQAHEDTKRIHPDWFEKI